MFMLFRVVFCVSPIMGTFLLTIDPSSATPQAGQYQEPVDVPRHSPRATRTKTAMVSAAHPLAARVGIEILKAGGSAIDAMVATQMVLNVVEPQSSGIGGGCFIVYYDARERKSHCIDGREECPAAARRADFLDDNGKLKPDVLTGGLPVGVPGTVAAMWLAHERWGKLPIAQVLEPAIKLAQDGIGVTPQLRIAIAVNQSRLLRFPSSKASFLRADGSVPEIGDVLKLPELANTLQLLARHGPRVFYEGEIARDIVTTVQSAEFQPGRLSLADLKSYQAVHREPLRFRYRSHELVTMPPPTSGGITVGMILGMLERAEFGKVQPATAAELDLLARVSAVAFADRNACLGDQDWSDKFEMRTLLEKEWIEGRALVAQGMRPGSTVSPGSVPRTTEGEHTTHFSIVDADRNVVACTTTIEHGMGSGLVVKGRGFLLNNELTDFDLMMEAGPNALDATRRVRRTALTNETGTGGKRPRSSMSPVIVFNDGQPRMTLGSPGGSQIINVVAQVLVNVLDHGMDMQEAINAPRFTAQNRPLALEGHYANREELIAGLRKAGWRVQNLAEGEKAWGGAQGIRILPDGTLEGGADPRREGAVRGY
jgi:gamma-glutamyltranspeptidase/glutathione hydrolase